MKPLAIYSKEIIMQHRTYSVPVLNSTHLVLIKTYGTSTTTIIEKTAVQKG